MTKKVCPWAPSRTIAAPASKCTGITSFATLRRLRSERSAKSGTRPSTGSETRGKSRGDAVAISASPSATSNPPGLAPIHPLAMGPMITARRASWHDAGVAHVVVFIPAWNEEENLPAVLDELGAELPGADVLVVDDGSTDATGEVARTRGAHVLAFPENRGLRAGIAAGYGYAHEHGYAVCGRVDADGQHPVAELRRLIAEVQAGRCDVAVGSSYLSGDRPP